MNRFRFARKPTLAVEQATFADGHVHIAGLDEVGRGAWAGPLVAGAVLLTAAELAPCRRLRRLVRDSKTLSEKQRERAYDALTQKIAWAVGMVSHAELDCCGLTAANQLAMERAIAALPRQPAFLLVDGRGFLFAVPNRQIIDGDNSVFCIAAASIIAKVTRDRMMVALHRRYPAYGFAHHKGYGTPEHQAALTQFGPCAIHRRSYRPIFDCMKTKERTPSFRKSDKPAKL
ncbi:MAG: ribonuclease HII [Patescibacteria group bacterium]|nr:ribonuclease HII [Patescibacteria group bacterium]